MTIEWASAAVWAVGGYLAVGVLFAVAFVARGAARIDPAAAGMPWGARLLILPGAAAVWPLMLAKWLGRRSPPLA